MVKKVIQKGPPKAGLTIDVARCSGCAIQAQHLPCSMPCTTHALPAFKDLTCFKIAHTKKGFQMWNRSDEIVDVAVLDGKK